MLEKENELFEMMFLQLVLSLNQAAMMQMGKLVNPSTGQSEVQLDQAQSTIDMLRTLQVKTKGQLSAREQSLLDQSVTNLQMNFVYEKDRVAKEKQKAAEVPAEPPKPANEGPAPA